VLPDDAEPEARLMSKELMQSDTDGEVCDGEKSL